MYLDQEFQLQIYYGRIVHHSLWLSVDEQLYRWRNESFGQKQNILSCEQEQWKNVTSLVFATGPSLNLSERLPISSNHDENYCWWQQMLNEQYIQMSVNGASTIGGFVSTVAKQYFGRCYA